MNRVSVAVRRACADRTVARTTKARHRLAGSVALLLAVGLVTISSVLPAQATTALRAAPSTTGWQTIATDDFSRTVPDGWGSARIGGSYTVGYSGRPTSGHFSVGDASGSMNLTPGLSGSATLGAVSAGDVEFRSTFALPTVGGVYYSTELRRQADGSAYRIQIKTMNSGAVVLSTVRHAGGVDTTVGQYVLPFTAAANRTVNLQAQIVGTAPVAMNAKAWLDGSAEPGWQTVLQDSAATRITAAGSIGLWVYLSSSSPATTVRTKALGAWAPGSTPPPTTTATTTPTTTPPTSTTSAAPTSTSTPTTPPPPPTTTTTTTTTTTAAPPSASGRGSVPVGTASYPVPAGAVFVDGARGSDGAVGSQTSPLKTVAAAIGKAPSGGTIVIRKGVYNESLSVGKTLTIQAYPNEAVWFDGSLPVTTWSKSGTRWVASGWTAEFDSSMGNSSYYARFVDPAYPLANRPDQVFYDGTALKQVASSSAVVAGTFFIDDAANTITLGSDPAGHEVRASNLAQAFYVTSTGTTLQGFGVRRYATPYQANGAVRMGNANGTVRDLVVQDNATIGVSMRNTNDRAERLTSTRNGLLGMAVNTADGLVVTNSVISDNNTEHFKPEPVAGGFKITRSRNVTFSNTEASRNIGSGIWFDESCVGITIANSTANSNTKHGIELEISEKAIVANNEAAENGDTGILIFDTGSVRVFNNNIGGNRLFAVQLKQDQRRQADASFAGHDPRQPIPDPTNPWITRNVTVSNNAFGTGGYFQFYALDQKTNISADNMNITMTGNLFNKRVAKTDPTMVAWGGTDNVTVTRYETPQALAAAKNTSWRNGLTATSLTLAQMSAEIQAAQSIAVAVPADIAAAIGVAAGTKRLGRIS